MSAIAAKTGSNDSLRPSSNRAAISESRVAIGSMLPGIGKMPAPVFD